MFLLYANTSETITVQQSSVDPARTEALSTAGESLDFVNPTVDLQIFAGGGDDIINLNGFGTGGGGFRAWLTVDGDPGLSDTINLNTSLALGSATSTGNVRFVAETINLAGNIATDGDVAGADAGTVSFFGPVVLKANVSIDTDATTDRLVEFTSTVNADDATANNRTLTINSGSNFIFFDSHIGNLQPLADLDVTATVTAVVGNITVNDGATPQTVTFNGQLHLDPPTSAKSIITNGVGADHGLLITNSLAGSSSLDIA